MKYTDKIDNAISYEDLDEELCEKIFEENFAFLKASINFLEETKEPNFFEKKYCRLYFVVILFKYIFII